MNKFIVRSVALLLLPCLVLDPATASSLTSSISYPPSAVSVHPIQLIRFQEEALELSPVAARGYAVVEAWLTAWTQRLAAGLSGWQPVRTINGGSAPIFDIRTNLHLHIRGNKVVDRTVNRDNQHVAKLLVPALKIFREEANQSSFLRWVHDRVVGVAVHVFNPNIKEPSNTITLLQPFFWTKLGFSRPLIRGLGEAQKLVDQGEVSEDVFNRLVYVLIKHELGHSRLWRLPVFLARMLPAGVPFSWERDVQDEVARINGDLEELHQGQGTGLFDGGNRIQTEMILATAGLEDYRDYLHELNSFWDLLTEEGRTREIRIKAEKTLEVPGVRTMGSGPRENVSGVATTGLTAERELPILRDILEKLKQEQALPGSVRLPKVVVISDQHGTIDKFDALILDAIRSALSENKIPSDFKLDPDKTLQEQLAYYGVELPRDVKGLINFHNLGDFMDRGPYGVKIFRRSMELVDMGLSDFVIGNHDFWEFMNLQAFHLPWYSGFNFYGYSDAYDASLGNVADVVRQHNEQEKETRTKTWWAERLAAFTAYHEKRQKDHWSRLDEIVNGKLLEKKTNKREPGLFSQVSASLKPDSKEKHMWDQFRGWYLVDIWTGTRAVGTVSIKWWEELLAEFKSAYGQMEQEPGFDGSLPAPRAWRTAIEMMEKDIIPPLKQDLDDHLRQGEWWWRVFEAINSQNYSSPEWWAKDWVFHEGWGTSVLKELNENAQDDQKITPSNYLDNPTLNRVAEFFRGYFTLYVRDVYQNIYMHGFLPVDNKTGEFFFTYKGQEYRGKGDKNHPSVWQGLDRITDDIRDRNNGLNDLYEALSLVNSWYADNTTQIKVPHVAEAINKFGPEKLADVNGFTRLYTGHLPFHEFAKLGDKKGLVTGFQVGGRLIFADHGMGTKFGSRGAWVNVDPSGLYLRGFEHEKSNQIVTHPRTVKNVEGTNGVTEQALFNNAGIPREEFLLQLIQDVEARIRELEFRGSPDQRLSKAASAGPVRSHLPTVEVFNRKAVRDLDLRGGVLYWGFDGTLWTGYPPGVEAQVWAEWAFNTSEPTTDQIETMAQFIQDTTGMNYQKRREEWYARSEQWASQDDIQWIRDEIGRRKDDRIEKENRVSLDYVPPGVPELLPTIKAWGVKQFAITGGHDVDRLRIAVKLGIDENFAGPFHGGGLKASFLINRRNKYGAHKVAVIGNSTYEIVEAKKAGVLAIAYAATPEDHERLLAAEPDVIINGDFAEKNQILIKALNIQGAHTISAKLRSPVGNHSSSLVQNVRVSESDQRVNIKFETAGWRALQMDYTPEEPKSGFTMDNVGRLSKAIAEKVKEIEPDLANVEVVVAYDARQNGPAFAQHIAEVIVAEGIPVALADGITSSPAAAAYSLPNKEGKKRYVIQMTASHNAAYYKVNVGGKTDYKPWGGVKIFVDGAMWGDQFTGPLGTRANEIKEYRYIPLAQIPKSRLRRNVDLITPYVERMREAFKPKELAPKVAKLLKRLNKPVTVDVMHGATAREVELLMPEVVPADRLKILNKTPMSAGYRDAEDGDTNLHPLFVKDATGRMVLWGPEPKPPFTDETLAQAGPKDMTVFQDGDGDRNATFEGQREFAPNELITLFTYYLLEDAIQKGKTQFTLVKTVPTTDNLYILKEHFESKYKHKNVRIEIKETPVGSKHFGPFFYESLLSGEESGHMYINVDDFVFADSALSETLLMLKIMVNTQLTLPQYYGFIDHEVGGLLKSWRTAVDPEINTPEFIAAYKKLAETSPEKFADVLAKALGKTLDPTLPYTTKGQGIKVRFNDHSWAQFRHSGTDGATRIYVESVDAAEHKTIATAVQNVLVELTKPAPAPVVRRPIKTVAVIGAGLMGAGIGYDLARAGYQVVFYDNLYQTKGDAAYERAKSSIEQSIQGGVQRRKIKKDDVPNIQGRVQYATSLQEAAEKADFVIEAVYESVDSKKKVFEELRRYLRPGTIIASNTSSIGLSLIAPNDPWVAIAHFFAPVASNKSVEVAVHDGADPAVQGETLEVLRKMGKRPVRVKNYPGSAFNHLFIPFADLAFHHETEGYSPATIDAALSQIFGAGARMFEAFVNLFPTWFKTQLDATELLRDQLGDPIYQVPDLLNDYRERIQKGDTLKEFAPGDDVDPTRFSEIQMRFLGLVFARALRLLEEGVVLEENAPRAIDDNAIGIFKWPDGPFGMMNSLGLKASLECVQELKAFLNARGIPFEVSPLLLQRVAGNKPWELNYVKSHVANHVATLTINRPEKLNALNGHVVKELREKFEEVSHDPDVNAIVLRGEGANAFMAGADLAFFIQNATPEKLDNIKNFTRDGQALLRNIANCPIPLVAYVNGTALGGGLELAMAAPIRVAASKGVLGYPEVTGVSIFPGLGGTYRTLRQIERRGLTKFLIFTGPFLTMEQASSLGLIDAPPSETPQLLQRVQELAGLGRLDPVSFRRELLGDRPVSHPEQVFPERLLAAFDHESADEIATALHALAGSSKEADTAIKAFDHASPMALERANAYINQAIGTSAADDVRLDAALVDGLDIFLTDPALASLERMTRMKRIPPAPAPVKGSPSGTAFSWIIGAVTTLLTLNYFASPDRGHGLEIESIHKPIKVVLESAAQSGWSHWGLMVGVLGLALVIASIFAIKFHKLLKEKYDAMSQVVSTAA